MSYDNTKFHAAFDAWLDQNTDVGFGEHYAGDLLDDFCSFLAETKMMKRSPGRVVFGRRLAEMGFDRRKSLGLTYWSGLSLKKPRSTTPKRYKKTVTAETREASERESIKLEKAKATSPLARKQYLDKFRADLDAEEERVRALEDQ
jgi:hypothetical protein